MLRVSLIFFCSLLLPSDIIYMEGHTMLHQEEEGVAEDILAAFQKGNHSKPTAEDVEKDNQDEQPALKSFVSEKEKEKIIAQKMDVRPEQGGEIVAVGPTVVAVGDNSKVMELLQSMNERMSQVQDQNQNLHDQVNQLRLRVEHLMR